MATTVHAIRNTSRDFPCVQCGGPGNIIREAPDPRVKCMKCNFMYNASDSASAKEAGSIPDGPPQLQETPPVQHVERPLQSPGESTSRSPIPRTPSHVFITKDRKEYEFCTKKDLKRIALKWETSDKTFECFELQPRKVSAKLSIE